MNRARSLGFAAMGLLVASCQVAPTRAADAVDPQRYGIVQDPTGKAAWERAQATLAKGDDGGALADLRIVVEHCPDLVRAHLAYQDAARKVGGAALQAMLDFYRALPDRNSPVPAYCRGRLADTSYAQGSALREILARDPSFAWAHLSMARLYRRKGQLPQAVDSFAAAILNDPALHEARLERAQVLTDSGKYEEAAVDYEKYLGHFPADRAAKQALAELAIYRLGRIDQALVLLTALEKERPDDLIVRMDRAAAQCMGGDPRAAIRTYLSVLEVDPDNARALLNIGLLYYEGMPVTPEQQQKVYWPKARAAFRLFLAHSTPQDGAEEFERILAVPCRLGKIADRIGAEPSTPPQLADLRLPGAG